MLRTDRAETVKARAAGRLGRAAAVLAAGGLAWGHFEAGWVRLETIECPLAGLPDELAGIRVVHLSDFHLGFPSRGARAVERAVACAEARSPDLVVVSGDLLARRSGEPRLRELLERLPNCVAVLGNHDFAASRDPFAQPAAPYDLGAATLLADAARTFEFNGSRVQVVGVDPRSYRRGIAHPERLADPAADLRILLCHFPSVVDKLEPGIFHLVVAGHLHAGQVCVPWPGGRVRLSHLRWTYVQGLYHCRSAVLHVSAGLGTTFVPFRFLARPEATELVLVPAGRRTAG